MRSGCWSSSARSSRSGSPGGSASHCSAPTVIGVLHGMETGVIVRSPDGEYTEKHVPARQLRDLRAHRSTTPQVPHELDPEADDNGVAAPRNGPCASSGSSCRTSTTPTRRSTDPSRDHRGPQPRRLNRRGPRGQRRPGSRGLPRDRRHPRPALTAPPHLPKGPPAHPAADPFQISTPSPADRSSGPSGQRVARHRAQVITVSSVIGLVWSACCRPRPDGRRVACHGARAVNVSSVIEPGFTRVLVSTCRRLRWCPQVDGWNPVSRSKRRKHDRRCPTESSRCKRHPGRSTRTRLWLLKCRGCIRFGPRVSSRRRLGQTVLIA